MPAGSKMLLVDKAEPISNNGSASVRTRLRRGKVSVQQPPRERSYRNNSADTNVSEEGGGEGAPDAGAEIPLQPLVSQAVPLQPMEGNGGADSHLQPLEEPVLVDAQRRL
ncbi:protein pxr1-like [Limosa lapponica baueri]|uniref:Protein pxr1-like n=1 Tax=Limosa lapponica baueri TaxID=1758121 RepID=A0A2I0UN24_LIMLA|nr:protein pxr1-like [Limosa lapponica baueri]